MDECMSLFTYILAFDLIFVCFSFEKHDDGILSFVFGSYEGGTDLEERFVFIWGRLLSGTWYVGGGFNVVH